MIRLRVAREKPVIWLLGDESANLLRSDITAAVDVAVHNFSFQGASMDSVVDGQLLSAIASGTQPSAVFVTAGAQDAIQCAIQNGTPSNVSTIITNRLNRIIAAGYTAAFYDILWFFQPSFSKNPSIAALGFPQIWLENAARIELPKPFMLYGDMNRLKAHLAQKSLETD